MHLFCYCSSENELLDLLFPENSISDNLGVNDVAHAVWSAHNFNCSLSVTGTLYFYLHMGIKLEDKKYRKINARYYVNSDSPVEKILLQSTVSDIAYQSFFTLTVFSVANKPFSFEQCNSFCNWELHISHFTVMYMTKGGLCCTKCFKCRGTC